MKRTIHGSPDSRLGLMLGLAVLLLGMAGCSPGRTLARAMLKSPNTYPDWLAPAARVSLRLPKVLVTNLPTQTVEVGPPAARLVVTHVPPGDYRATLSTTNRQRGSRTAFSFSMRAVFPPRACDRPDAPRGTVFLLHGYGVDSLSMLPWGVILAEAGYQALLVDLRGHGESSGRELFFGTVEADDLRQVLTQVSAEGKVHGPVAVVGDSLGAALALRWAATDPRIHAVVALAPYAELETAVLGIREDYAAWLPRPWVRDAARRLPDLLEVRPETLDTAPLADGLRTPVLLVAAGQDRIAPAPAVGRLARLCRGPVKYFVVASATHETLPYQFEELESVVMAWLEAYCRVSGSEDSAAAQPGSALPSRARYPDQWFQ